MSEQIPPRDYRPDSQVGSMMINDVMEKFNIPALTLPRKPLGSPKGPAGAHKGPRTGQRPSGRGRTAGHRPRRSELSDY